MNTMELFRKILLGEPLGHLINEDPELLSFHGLSARLYRLLEENHPQKNLFLPAHLYVVQRRAIYQNLLKRIVPVFAENGIRPLVIKGMVLADRFYPHPEDRTFSDLDLVLQEKDREMAQEILQRDFIKIPQKRFSRNEHKEDWLKKENPDCKVELHFGLGEYGSFAREEWGNVSVLEKEDEFLYLLWHGFVQHRMQKLIWFLDLFLLSQKIEYSRIQEKAKEKNLVPALEMYLRWMEWLQLGGKGDSYLERVIFAKNEKPYRAAQMRAKVSGGWIPLLQYAWQRKFSNDEF